MSIARVAVVQAIGRSAKQSSVKVLLDEMPDRPDAIFIDRDSTPRGYIRCCYAMAFNPAGI
jgi:hypothetical protein